VAKKLGRGRGPVGVKGGKSAPATTFKDAIFTKTAGSKK
jgi:hypothetical protein